MLKILLYPFVVLFNLLFEQDNDTFISKEGYEILNDPVRKEKLQKVLENYRKTGSWDGLKDV
jgi:hypothetical protein